jgi:RimJ/RimL family protein N-acetyltransferase
MARMFLPTPTLRTARLGLRPFTSADALFALHSSAYVLRYWDAPPWSERARAERFIAACGRMAEEDSGRGWPWTVFPTRRSSDGAV